MNVVKMRQSPVTVLSRLAQVPIEYLSHFAQGAVGERGLPRGNFLGLIGWWWLLIARGPWWLRVVSPLGE